MMTRPTMLIREARQFLGVRLPVTVNLYAGTDTPHGWDGAYTLHRRRRHIIDVARQASRGRWTILAHELVHAYVEENAPDAPVHGFMFQYYAQRFENHLQSLGWAVETIFDKALDK